MFLLFLRDIICQSKDLYEDTELFLTELRPKFIMAFKGLDKDRVFTSIKYNGFTPHTLQLIENYINDIYNGNTNFDRFNTPEHAGLCSAGKVLIGAETIVSYARASLDTGGDAGKSKATVPNWQIDETQEKFVEQWAKTPRTSLWRYTKTLNGSRF